MKKVILLAAVVLAVGTTVTSCKKNYTCKCSKTYTSGTSTTTSDYSMYTYKDTKKKAIERCDENAKSGSDFGGNYAINCQIQ